MPSLYVGFSMVDIFLLWVIIVTIILVILISSISSLTRRVNYISRALKQKHQRKPNKRSLEAYR